MKYLPILLFLCLPLLLTQCSTTERTPRVKVTELDESDIDFSSYRDLAQVLREFSDVWVRGGGDHANIQIRGASSFGENAPPLYVIDGRDMGHSYAEINRYLNMRDISNIKILTDIEAGQYGMRGAGGVIVITRRM